MNEKPKKLQFLRPAPKEPETSLLSESKLPEDVVQELMDLGYTTQRDLALGLQDYGYGRVRSYAEVRRLCLQTNLSSYDNTMLGLLREVFLKRKQAADLVKKRSPSLPLSQSKLSEPAIAGLYSNGFSTQRDLAYALRQYGYKAGSAITEANRLFNAKGASRRSQSILDVLSGATKRGKVHVPKINIDRDSTPLTQSQLPESVINDLRINGFQTRADLALAFESYGYTLKTAQSVVYMLSNGKKEISRRVLEIVNVLCGRSVDGRVHLAKNEASVVKSKHLSESRLPPDLVNVLAEKGCTKQQDLVAVFQAGGYAKSSADSLACRFCAGSKLPGHAVGIIGDFVGDPGFASNMSNVRDTVKSPSLPVGTTYPHEPSP